MANTQSFELFSNGYMGIYKFFFRIKTFLFFGEKNTANQENVLGVWIFYINYIDLKIQT